MRISLSALLVASLTLGACGGSLNPFGWFGRSTSEVAPPQDDRPVNPLIPTGGDRSLLKSVTGIGVEPVYNGKPFGEVVQLVVERRDGGAIVRVTGRSDRQGVYDVRLTPMNEDEQPVDGELTYRLEGLEPTNTRVGSPASREVTVARSLTDQKLRGVRSIRVEGLRNSRVVRR
ncbi:MAG: hypothetical protein ABJN72_00220 [Sulfitobacter sp.]